MRVQDRPEAKLVPKREAPRPLTSPSPRAERGPGGEVKPAAWHTPPDLWKKLKPVARQMRHQPTPEEKTLWQCLRGRQLAGLRFRRQHAIDRFIVDFYCAEARLVIEVDGPIHQYSQEQDGLRQEFLESRGLRVLRFTNDEVAGSVERVLARIAAGSTSPPGPLSARGEGEPVKPNENVTEGGVDGRAGSRVD